MSILDILSRNKAQAAPAVSFAMYDAVDVRELPTGQGDWAVAGYVGGNWPTWNQVRQQYPNHRKLSIAVFASLDADCLDVEQGDATPNDAVNWTRRQRNRYHNTPTLYIQLSNAQYLVDLLDRSGIPRSAYKLWVAHYTGHPHICGPSCGFGLRTNADATQWTSQGFGRNLDISLCKADFFGKIAPERPDHLPLKVDGSFGPNTIKALQWCLNHKPRAPQLVVDGSFGPDTRTRLGHYLRVDRGGAVAARALQRHVRANVDGKWGQDTTRHLQEALNNHRF